MSQYALGIDLGTTNSAVAIYSGGEPEILRNSAGDELTPSVVRYPASSDERTSPYVGRPAKNALQMYPDRTIRSIKRHMGDEYNISLEEESYSPEEISATILRHLKQEAADRLQIEFNQLTEAVITVPAYFEEPARQATLRAAEMAEFEDITLINEPSAAALDYGYQNQDSERTLLVYDLGGGTFDASVLSYRQGEFTVESAGGDRDLGGDDWDQAIVEWAATQFEEQHGVHPFDPQPGESDVDVRKRRIRLTEEAQSKKEDLCLQGAGQVIIRQNHFMTGHDGQPLHLELPLTLKEFEEVTAPLLERTRDPTLDVLDEAEVRQFELDDILLVGGATRMPQVTEFLERELGIIPRRTDHPDKTVARGAAIHGNDDSVELFERTPLSLGIKLRGGKFKPLVDRNTPLPASGSEIFTTSEPHQTSVKIDVYQGERPVADENIHLRDFYLTGLPPVSAGVPRIRVTFRVDEEGIVTAYAEDETSEAGNFEEVTIEGLTDTSDADIDRHITEARAKHKQDRELTETMEAKSRSRKAVQNGEDFLDAHPGILDDSEHRQLENALDSLSELLKESSPKIDDLEELSRTVRELTSKGHERRIAILESETTEVMAGPGQHTNTSASSQPDSESNAAKQPAEEQSCSTQAQPEPGKSESEFLNNTQGIDEAASESTGRQRTAGEANANTNPNRSPNRADPNSPPGISDTSNSTGEPAEDHSQGNSDGGSLSEVLDEQSTADSDVEVEPIDRVDTVPANLDDLKNADESDPFGDFEEETPIDVDDSELDPIDNPETPDTDSPSLCGESSEEASETSDSGSDDRTEDSPKTEDDGDQGIGTQSTLGPPANDTTDDESDKWGGEP